MAHSIADIVTAPVNGATRGIAITTSSAATAIPTQWGTGDRYVTMIADVQFWFRFGGSGDTVDESDVDGTDDPVRVPADTYVSLFIPAQFYDKDGDECTHILLKGASAGTLSTWLSSPER